MTMATTTLPNGWLQVVLAEGEPLPMPLPEEFRLGATYIRVAHTWFRTWFLRAPDLLLAFEDDIEGDIEGVCSAGRCQEWLATNGYRPCGDQYPEALEFTRLP
jgi:hypothetical protein